MVINIVEKVPDVTITSDQIKEHLLQSVSNLTAYMGTVKNLVRRAYERGDKFGAIFTARSFLPLTLKQAKEYVETNFTPA